MSGIWLSSYVALWVLVVALCLFMIGLLRQLGVLQSQFEHPPVTIPGANMPALEDDGPAIGSPFPQFVAETVNGFGTVALATQRRASRTLVMFMSPLCESCQHMIGSLNALMDDPAQDLFVIVLLRGDKGMCRSFLSVFPLRLPAICDDDDSSIHRGLNVHRAPLGLLYDEHGMLIRKGVTQTDDSLQVLLGNKVSSTTPGDVYPPIAVLV